MSDQLLVRNQTHFRNPTLLLDPVMRHVGNDDPVRPELEHFIASTYQSIFNARLNSFLPNLVAATTAKGKICAAFGYSDAAQGSLFLESYLDRPVETLLSETLSCSIMRHQIVEVGNLSITKNIDTVRTMRDIASYLQDLGYEWIVCTATRYLRVLFLKSGSRPISIAKALSSNVTNDGTDWGSYYETIPEILAGNVDESVTLIEQSLDLKHRLPVRPPSTCPEARLE